MGVYGSGIYGQGVYGGTTALSLTVQDTYPDRVLLSATNVVPGQVVTISRRVAGSAVRTAVRGANGVSMSSDTLVKVDAEEPFGIELTYFLTVDGVDLDSEIVTLALDKVALSDAISGDAAEVVILSWPNKKRERNSSVYSVAGRNIVVAGQRGGFSGTLEIFVETDDAKNNLLDLLDNATSGVIQIRSDRSQTSDGVDCYVAVLVDDEGRWSQDGSDERRVIALDVVETTPWGPTLESSTFTYADVAAHYTGETYADWAADYASYLAAALGDYS